jgi:hypothetical protein
MSDPKLDLLQGTLDLMVLKTLAAMGELHGYGIARRRRLHPGAPRLTREPDGRPPR